MKSKLLLALTAGLLFCSTRQNAQVSAYSFTQTASSYGSASTGTVVGLPFQDDDVNTVTLPFSFTYNGTAYTSMDVCSNGYMSFSSLTGFEYPPISDGGTTELISPFGTDLLMGVLISADLTTGSNTLTNCSSVTGYSVGDILYDYNSDFGTNPTITAINGNNIVVNANALTTVTTYDVANTHGYIKQNVTGTAPNRICEFEYRNFSRFLIPDEMINFKVRLYETTNKIEFLYGAFVPGADNTPPEVGLKGNSNTDFNSRKVNAPVLWANSVASSVATDFCDFYTSHFPSNGQSYMWTPVSCTVPVLAVSPASTVVCSGQSVVLTASGATTYSWTNGPVAAQNTVTPSATTHYTLTGANTTCTSSLVYTLNVTPNPTLNIAQSSASICAGQSATLTASGATSYSWNGTANPPEFVVTPNSTTTYSLIGSNGNCSATQTIVQAVVSMPTPSIAAGSLALCPGELTTLTASGATSFTWSSTTGSTSINTATVLAGPGIYSVSASNGSGACAASAFITVGIANCTGIEETSGNALTSISAYPNPFNTALHVKNTADKDQSVVISDALGKVIYHATVKAGTTEVISGEALTSGLYFISVSGSKGSITKKLIKE